MSKPGRARPRDSGRNAQLRRALTLVNMVGRSGRSLKDLAEALGTNQRTIRRDLLALTEAGFRFAPEQPGKEKLWKLQEAPDARKLYPEFDAFHFLAIRTALIVGGPLRKENEVHTALEDLQDRIQKVIGAQGREQLAAIDNCLFLYEKHAYRKAPPDVLWALVSAATKRSLCTVTHRSPRPNAPVQRFEVLPLRIFVHNRAAYLMCHVTKYDAVRTLNLQRIKEVKVLERQGTVPAHFKPELLEEAAFGVHVGAEKTTYVLQFDAQVAEYIREREWHSSQVLRELAGGDVELRFTCGQSWEVSAWVASWRHWVRVLEPASLQEELRELGAALLERYASTATAKPRTRSRHSHEQPYGSSPKRVRAGKRPINVE